jgi:hypothetical protein
VRAPATRLASAEGAAARPSPLCSRPSLSGGGTKGRFLASEVLLLDDEAVSDASWEAVSSSPSAPSTPVDSAPRATFGDFLAAAQELGALFVLTGAFFFFLQGRADPSSSFAPVS